MGLSTDWARESDPRHLQYSPLLYSPIKAIMAEDLGSVICSDLKWAGTDDQESPHDWSDDADTLAVTTPKAWSHASYYNEVACVVDDLPQ